MVTQKQIQQLLHYDPDTGIFTWRERDISLFDKDWIGRGWNTKYAGKITGTKFKNPDGKRYLVISIFNKSYLAHRLAWLYMTGSFPDELIDHINGNGRDNRWVNLREVSTLENNRNMRKAVDNKSGITGVSYCKRDKLHVAYINVKGKHISLGWFKDFFDACCVRKSAEYKLGFHQNHGSDRPL